MSCIRICKKKLYCIYIYLLYVSNRIRIKTKPLKIKKDTRKIISDTDMGEKREIHGLPKPN